MLLSVVRGALVRRGGRGGLPPCPTARENPCRSAVAKRGIPAVVAQCASNCPHGATSPLWQPSLWRGAHLHATTPRRPTTAGADLVLRVIAQRTVQNSAIVQDATHSTRQRPPPPEVGVTTESTCAGRRSSGSASYGRVQGRPAWTASSPRHARTSRYSASSTTRHQLPRA